MLAATLRQQLQTFNSHRLPISISIRYFFAGPELRVRLGSPQLLPVETIPCDAQ